MSKRNDIMNNSSINNKNNTGKIENLSIKEQMMGVKSTKPLPKDFYEKILECEMSLKEKFDMSVLGTLIQYYSLAVEHFGSIGDVEKCAEYNENLNLLFKQMEVKKYMDEGTNIESNAKKDEVKQEMHKAENKITNKTVKSILKDKETKQNKLIVKIKDEVTLNAGRKIVKNVFDQNRVYLALNYQFNKALAMEIGYMNWYQQRSSGVDFYSRDIFRFSLFHKISLKPKQ